MRLERNLEQALSKYLPDLDDTKRAELLDNLVKVTKRSQDKNDISDLLEYLGYDENDIATKLTIAYFALKRLIAAYPNLVSALQTLTEDNEGLVLSDFDALHLVSKCVDWKVHQRGANTHIHELISSLAESTDSIEEVETEEPVDDEELVLPKELREE